MEIEFYSTNLSSIEYQPIPARNSLPDWINNLKPVMHDVKTIKSCPVVIDYLISGYFLLSYQDYRIVRKCIGDKEQIFINGVLQPASKIEEGLESMEAFQDHLITKTGIKKTLWKIESGWSWKTPPGWSTLILPTWYHFNPHQVFPSIVDSDNFQLSNTSLGFISTHQNLEEESWIIKKGDPLAVLMPIKREEWTSSFNNYVDDEKDYQKECRIRKSFN